MEEENKFGKNMDFSGSDDYIDVNYIPGRIVDGYVDNREFSEKEVKERYQRIRLAYHRQ